ETKKWIEAVFKTQREDGYFGPRSSLTSLDGKPDMWPNMLMLNVMQSYYEFSGDKRVLDFMTRYFKWQQSVPEKDFMAGYWPKMRAATTSRAFSGFTTAPARNGIWKSRRNVVATPPTGTA